MDTSDFLHQSNHFYSFSSSRIMVDYRLCVVFFVFLASLAAPKYDSVRSLYMKDGSLDIFFLANSSHHPINPSIYFMLFP